MSEKKQKTRLQQIGYRKPTGEAEPDQLALVEYAVGERVVIITLNRPHADNAITTELAAHLIKILETIAARPSVRVAILTGIGDRAFSVGGDLYQRRQMTKEQWLRQRQVFDRLLYTLRQLRRPIIALRIPMPRARPRPKRPPDSRLMVAPKAAVTWGCRVK